ncbi:hypothetical protein RJD24_04790 [Bacillaceae bacterium IKA-2]|nr:hypothetical protein RJD24_04790 [Bacillaceae bacterium IKA-2]
MAIIISSIVTVFLVGVSTGGLFVSRRIDPHQSLFLVAAFAFFVFCSLGMFIGRYSAVFLSPTLLSVVFGLYCLGLIGFLIWKYDPSFGYVKHEPASLAVFLVLFLLLGMQLAIVEIISMWLSIVFSLIFIGGFFLGFIFIYRVTHQRRSPQIFALIPLIPILFIAIFKLI